MRTLLYILGPDHVPMPEPDVRRWAEWVETADCLVAATEIQPGLEVSTVFLGLDHAHGRGPRQLFETLVFYQVPDGEVQIGDTNRYPTWAQAVLGHQRMVAHVRASMANQDTHR